jgi:gamma-butyrobetaine dioxygenase
VPARSGEVAEVAGRIGFVWSHAAGNTFDIRPCSPTESLAYTSLGLPPHTDLPSRASPPTVQLLLCLDNDVEGGDLILVDGWTVAAELRATEPLFYQLLSEVSVEFRFAAGKADYRFRGPILAHDAAGDLRQIRLNSFLQSPFDLPGDLIDPFYRAYRALLALTRDRRFQVRVRLQSGDLMSFDNHRVLHGRTPFDPTSGRRHLQACYLETDELESCLRWLERSRRRFPS